MTTKPLWDAPPAVMTKWVNEQLDRMKLDELEEAFQWADTPEVQEVVARYDAGWGEEIQAAMYGNLAPIRKRLVTLARNPEEAAALAKIAQQYVHFPPPQREMGVVNDVCLHCHIRELLGRQQTLNASLRYGARNIRRRKGTA